LEILPSSFVLREYFQLWGNNFQCTVLGSDAQSGSDRQSLIPNPMPNPSRSEPNNFSFNTLLSFRSPIWTYNYPFSIVTSMSVTILYKVWKWLTSCSVQSRWFKYQAWRWRWLTDARPHRLLNPTLHPLTHRHSVTCHLTQVNTPHINHRRVGEDGWQMLDHTDCWTLPSIH